jgi:hypothetical protein
MYPTPPLVWSRPYGASWPVRINAEFPLPDRALFYRCHDWGLAFEIHDHGPHARLADVRVLRDARAYRRLSARQGESAEAVR